MTDPDKKKFLKDWLAAGRTTAQLERAILQRLPASVPMTDPKTGQTVMAIPLGRADD